MNVGCDSIGSSLPTDMYNGVTRDVASFSASQLKQGPGNELKATGMKLLRIEFVPPLESAGPLLI